MRFTRLFPCNGLWTHPVKESCSRRSNIPVRCLFQQSETTAGHSFQDPRIRMTPKLIRMARFTKKLSWTEEPPQFITRSEHLAMRTISRIKVNVIGVVFMICLALSIIRKGREIKKRGRTLSGCSQEQVDTLRLKHLLEQKRVREAAAETSKA
ncbi:uncharacterized protein LOC133185403 [Saccostrea echinata]|uniref:uncharacterized protein LOC133185403 n=1 Tax=Saccostrea echinata TaxID=191078 RepID=UPI002A7FE04B|nr:uncharacterized protein LOC133185403 [Saccostrea echinata]